MIEKLKQEAMRQGMKLMSNPKFMKMMADPRLMNAISQAFALKEKVQTGIGHHIRQMAEAFNLATKDDVEDLRQSLSQTQSSVSRLERKNEE